MKKIVLAFDSFKGSASSWEISEAARRAILRELPQCEVISIPIADGGEGTTRAICSVMNTTVVSCEAHNPMMHPLTTSYHITADGETAILEMAATSGLPLLSSNQRNPLYTSTFGTGEVVIDALNRGCRHFILGIGGSATNDAGTGMLAALGVRFLNNRGEEVKPCGKNLTRIEQIDESHADGRLKDCHFTIICDVNNPFYGADGAAFVYAPQKGASPQEVLQLDAGLRHYAHVLKLNKGIDIAGLPGAGAAGGMGGGLLPFLNAELKPGIETILELLHFDEALQEADLVITGEGWIDAQTTMGKALGGVLKLATKQSVPVIALGGGVENTPLLNEMGFAAVLSIQPAPVSLEQAMQTEFTLSNIERTVTQVVRLIQSTQTT